MAVGLCQKCFDGTPPDCACSQKARPWEAPAREQSRMVASYRPRGTGRAPGSQNSGDKDERRRPS